MNFGNVLIILSLIVTAGAAFFYYKSIQGSDFDKKLSRIMTYSATGLIVLSYIMLTIAFMTNDYSYAYVYGYSSRELEWYYLLSATWAGQAGSFLLWGMLLSVFGIYVIRTKDRDEGILMLVVLLTQFFILLVLLQDSPFKYIWEGNPNLKPGQVPSDGSGLNPLLIDPWMVLHPPVLFMGYASATIPFAYAIAALVRNEYDAWVDKSYKWVLFSFVTLGIGIFLGGYWAYTVLGWGGYWGWDPVENSSLIPWLVGLIMFHGMILQRRKKILVKTNLVSAILYIILTFYSTYLTRSGVLSNFSVHSFGDSIIGIFLLSFLAVLTISAVGMLLYRIKNIKSKAMGDDIFGWETLLVYGLICLGIYTLLILIGTSMPIITGILFPKASAVTEGYYNNLSIPFILLILALMIMSTMSILSKKIIKNRDLIILAGAGVLAVFFNLYHTNRIIAYVFTAISIFVIVQYIKDFIEIRKPAILASRLAHIGLGLLVIGAITSNLHSSSEQKKIVLGKPDRVGPVSLRFNGFTNEKNSSILFTVKDGNIEKNIKTKYYMSEKMNSLYREPYIIYGFFSDIYIIPEKFEEGNSEGESAVISKNEQKTIGGISVTFLGFDSSKMTAADPEISAMLLVNGMRLSPGIKINRQQSNRIDSKIPGTERFVSLHRINPSQNLIDLYVSPDPRVATVPDGVIVNVSSKRFIWFVWLGTVLITAGSIVAFVRFRKAGAIKA